MINCEGPSSVAKGTWCCLITGLRLDESVVNRTDAYLFSVAIASLPDAMTHATATRRQDRFGSVSPPTFIYDSGLAWLSLRSDEWRTTALPRLSAVVVGSRNV